jgi:hypothetical protein
MGNATCAAEGKKAKGSGNAYGNFILAVKNRQRETTFYPVRCFGKLADGVTACTVCLPRYLSGWFVA